MKGAFGVREQWTSGSDIPGKLEFIEEDFLLLGLLHKEIVEKHGASYARLWLASTFTRSAEVVGQVRVPAAEHTVVPLDDPPVTYLLSELIESGALRGLVRHKEDCISCDAHRFQRGWRTRSVGDL